MATGGGSSSYSFGHIQLNASQVFIDREHCFGAVNLKPVVPGHVLIICRQAKARVRDLSHAELTNMWVTAQTVANMLENTYGCDAVTFAIQDGASAGQTVPQCHIHVLPRKSGDFDHNDQVYDKLESKSHSVQPLDLDDGRVARTNDEMKSEADTLRANMARFS